MPFAASWMDLEAIILSEVSQRKTSIIYHYMWKLNYDTIEIIYRTGINPQTQKTNLWLPMGKGGEGEINYEFGPDINTLLEI